MNNKEKYRQARKEAAATGLALFALIVFWLFAGFGASSLDAKIFSLPLWAVLSTVGTWLAAILIAIFLTKRVFRDMSLEDEEEQNG